MMGFVYDTPPTSQADYTDMTTSYGYDVTLTVLWCMVLLTQITQISLRETWFSATFIFTCILEIVGFIGRCLGHSNSSALAPILMNSLCLLVAPVFAMGGIYFQLSRLIDIYGERFSLLKARNYAKIFITSDVITFLIQSSGGGLVGAEASGKQSLTTGTDIVLAGIALQVLSMGIFLCLILTFFYKVFIQTRMQYAETSKFQPWLFQISQSEIDYLYDSRSAHIRLPPRFLFKYFPAVLVFSICTIFIRCFYRLIQFGQGWGGSLIKNPAYFIGLDSVMMLVALISLTIFHPGFVYKSRTEEIHFGKFGFVKRDTHSKSEVSETNGRYNRNPFENQDAKVV